MKRILSSILLCLYTAVSLAAGVGNTSLAPLAKQQFNYNGAPIANGLLFTYGAGTSTKQATYTDSTGSTPNTNPIVLDANGQANVWLNPQQSYKFILSPAGDTDPPTNSYWTVDNIPASGSIPAGMPYAVAGGTSDAITASYTVSSPFLTDGLDLTFKAGSLNTTTTPTFKPTLNGSIQPTQTIVKYVNGSEVALVAGDIQGDVWVKYDGTNSLWVLQMSLLTIPNGATATTQAQGDNSTKIATDAYVDRMVPSVTGNSGKFLSNNGTSTAWSSLGQNAGRAIFLSSGAFTFPAGTTTNSFFKFTIIGGGGGGGAGNGSGQTGSGGGAGGASIKWLSNMTSGNTIIVTIGAGGTAGASGGASSISSGTQVITTVTAGGGAGGTTGGPGGLGGTSTNADLQMYGQPGESGLGSPNVSPGAAGGASILGGGGQGSGGYAQGYGGGGGGGANGGTNSGGAGGSGVIIIEWIL